MKTLTLLRHAKSTWDDPVERDFDRPLNGRGRRAAARIGQWLADDDAAFDEVRASPAIRVRQTIEGIEDGPAPATASGVRAAHLSCERRHPARYRPGLRRRRPGAPDRPQSGPRGPAFSSLPPTPTRCVGKSRSNIPPRRWRSSTLRSARGATPAQAARRCATSSARAIWMRASGQTISDTAAVSPRDRF